MTRPILNKIPLSEVVLFAPGTVTITMSVGQWDALLAAAYNQGAFLLELDEQEKPVAVYRRVPSEITLTA